MAAIFTRFSETINLKENKKIFSIAVKPFITDCTGKVYFTDIQVQEGDKLTGYTPNTETMLKKYRVDGIICSRVSNIKFIFSLTIFTKGC
jgi:hypothetical protein